MSEPTDGKKIFFLYPQSVIQQELISFLLKNEYEVYFLNDHLKAIKVFKQFPNSICFINIDDGLKETEWEKYIMDLRANSAISGIQIGILSYNNDPNLMKKYLMDIGVECGFIQLKLGVKQSTDIILKVLEANEAKGRRKFVRANCENETMVIMNFSYRENSYKGQILDISSVGIAGKFSGPVPLDNKTVISNIQLNLKGSLVQADGIILSRRFDSANILVILFNPRLEELNLEKVHNFIHRTLQKTIDI
jgi:hypothetical protein